MSGFRIDVCNASGNKDGGLTIAVSNVKLNEKANRIGQAQFTVPAIEAASAGMQYGKRYRLYSERDGYVGLFTHKSIAVDADARTATVVADDSLIDLANVIVGFNRRYSDTSVKTIIEELAALAGWTVEYEPYTAGRYQNERVSLEFQGESILTALDFVRSYMRGFFRKSGDTRIRFGFFRDLAYQTTQYANSTRVQLDGSVATVPTKYNDATWQFRYAGNDAILGKGEIDAWLINPPIMSDAIERNNEIRANDGRTAGDAAPFGVILRLQKTVDGAAVVNRVIPRGAGQDQTQIDLRYSTLSGNPYIIGNAANADGSLHYYIEDAASVAAYGRVTRVLPFSEVRPITNSAADIRNAANALYVLGVAYLRKFKQPYEVYSVQCANLPLAVTVGSVVVVDYRGVAEMPGGEVAYLHVNKQPFFVIEKTTTWTESGEPIYDLVISTNGEGAVSTTDIFINTLRDIEKFKARPEPTITYYSNSTGTEPVSSNPPVTVTFPFQLDAGVLFINDMVIEMQLSRLTAYGVSNIRPGAFTALPPPSEEETTDGGTLTTSGPSTLTTSEFNTAISTTSMGGGALTTTSQGGQHGHFLPVSSSPSGGPTYTVLYDPGFSQLYVPGASFPNIKTYLEDFHTHSINIPSHTHGFTLPAHQHGIAHTHTMSPHTHRHPHTHPITADILETEFGVFQSPTLPTNVTVRLNGAVVTGWQVAQNIDSASTNGTVCHGAGLFRANITNRFPPPGTTIQGTYTIEISTTGNAGLVFTRVLGRVTIQPIAV